MSEKEKRKDAIFEFASLQQPFKLSRREPIKSMVLARCAIGHDLEEHYLAVEWQFVHVKRIVSS